MLVKASIITPLIDQFFLRIFKYNAIKIISPKKEMIPSNTLTGYLMGFFAISPKATIEYHKIVHKSPDAPRIDNPKDITEVFILQYFLTVFGNNKQKTDETTKVIPNKSKINGKPSNNDDNINTYVGASAPPIIPIAPLFDVQLFQ